MNRPKREKITSWRMSAQARQRLESLAKQSNRNMANVLETLVLSEQALSILIGSTLACGGPNDDDHHNGSQN